MPFCQQLQFHIVLTQHSKRYPVNIYTYIICPNIDFKNLVFFAEIHYLNELQLKLDRHGLAKVEDRPAIGPPLVV